jgi:hypothetical protein
MLKKMRKIKEVQKRFVKRKNKQGHTVSKNQNWPRRMNCKKKFNNIYFFGIFVLFTVAHSRDFCLIEFALDYALKIYVLE